MGPGTRQLPRKTGPGLQRHRVDQAGSTVRELCLETVIYPVHNLSVVQAPFTVNVLKPFSYCDLSLTNWQGYWIVQGF